MLDREKIIKNLSDKETEVIVYNTIGSTNDAAKEMCRKTQKDQNP